MSGRAYEIRVGAVIVSFDGGEESGAGGEERTVEPGDEPPKRPTMQGLPKPDAPPSPPPELPEGVRPGASPTIRKMARDLGIDLRRIRGTARGGRIMCGGYSRLCGPSATGRRYARIHGPAGGAPARGNARDRFFALGSGAGSTRHRAAEDDCIPNGQFLENDSSRRTVRRRGHHRPDGASQTVRPDLQGTERATHLTPILLKAVANALARHPVVNSSWDEASGDIVLKDYVHIGLAVDTDAGLIVPCDSGMSTARACSNWPGRWKR